jgi:4,5-DOPA dioxygenase extradiol
MNLKALNRLSELPNTTRMPVLFIGHGSPMNALEENSFVSGIRQVGKELQKPKAILCISAHWETKGTYVTAMESPKTIHDFRGFPKELYDVQYPAAGSPDLAKETKRIVRKTEIGLDYSWGLDHGSWSVIKHLYPDADIPTIQLSIDYTKPAQYHFELAKELSSLREKGIFIVGSGNMVHNLGLVAWDKLSGEPFAYDWAIEANEKMKSDILNNDIQGLIDFRKRGKAFDLAIPTPEHFLPLIYSMALKNNKDDTTLFNDQPIGGSLSMTSVKLS